MESPLFQQGLKDGLPICLGYISVAFTFGMMATEGGLAPWSSLLISMTNLTSAGQFAGTALILSGGTLLEIAVTTFVINIRYMLMSLSLSQKLDPGYENGGAADSVLRRHRRGVCCSNTAEKGADRPLSGGADPDPLRGLGPRHSAGRHGYRGFALSVRSALGIAIYGMFIAIIIPPSRRRPVAITVVLAAA